MEALLQDSTRRICTNLSRFQWSRSSLRSTISRSLCFYDALEASIWSDSHIVITSVVKIGELIWCLSLLKNSHNFILIPNPPSLTRDVWRRVRYFPSSDLILILYKLVPVALFLVIFIWSESNFAEKIIPDLSSIVLNQRTSINLPTFPAPSTTWLPMKDGSHSTRLWL